MAQSTRNAPALDALGGSAKGDSSPAATERPRARLIVHDPALREEVRLALSGDWSVDLSAEGAPRPDLFVADAEEASVSTLRALRHDERTRDVPAILLTERGADLSLAGLDADADEYLLRPVAPVDLTRRAKAHLERARGRRSAADRERAARLEAEAASRAKDEFIAMISHELRTPLGAILIWAQLLKGEELEPEAVGRAVSMIERSTKTLAQLIDDLLDVSRIIAGKLTFEKRPVDLGPVIDAALDAAGPAARGKGVALERRGVDHLPPVAGDAGRLQQVVGNLLANAVKFTSEGGRVDVLLERSDDRARIVVRDSGTGISPEMLPFIFEKFRQADSTTTRRQKGLGLGLAIARHIVELLGGTIAADSAGEGRGSTFTVLLPLLTARELADAGRAEDPAARQPTLDGIRVLVVDDEEDAREAMVVLLTQVGALVVAVASAAEAMEALDRDRPDVMLSDIAMPGEDGYALIHRVRGLPAERGGRVPAAALTAYATLDDRARALRAGYDEHIPKPVDPARLIGAVAFLVADALRTRG